MLYICKGFSIYLQEGCKQELVHSARGTKKARKQVPAKTYMEKKGTNYSERAYIRSGHDVKSVQRVRYREWGSDAEEVASYSPLIGPVEIIDWTPYVWKPELS